MINAWTENFIWLLNDYIYSHLYNKEVCQNSFLQELLERATKNVQARLHVDETCEEEQIISTEKHKKKLKELKENCEKVSYTL